MLVWRTAGYEKEGDKFASHDSPWWALLMDDVDSRDFWSEMTALARQSDRWSLAQGKDPLPPKVDWNALLNRQTPWLELITTRRPIWDLKPPARSAALTKYISDAYAKLKQWRKDRRVPGPLRPLVPSKDSGNGGMLLLAAILLAAAIGGRGKRRRG